MIKKEDLREVEEVQAEDLLTLEGVAITLEDQEDILQLAGL